MAEIPQHYISNYADALDKVSAALKVKLRTAFKNADFSDVAKAREQVKDIMELLTTGAIRMSGTLACDLYDLLRKMSEEKSSYQSLLVKDDDVYSFEQIDSDVRFFMTYIVEAQNAPAEDAAAKRAALSAAASRVLSECESKIDYVARKAAGDTMLLNVRKDPAKPRFARVPVGPDSCEFCIMLASQGFVYCTAETAGRHRHYHANCRCQIVPGFNGVTSVQGYDPDAYYQQWRDNEAARKEKGLETISSKGARLRAERKQRK